MHNFTDEALRFIDSRKRRELESSSIGEVTFVPDTSEEPEHLVAKVEVAEDGSVNVEVQQTSTSWIIGSVSISPRATQSSEGER